MNKRPKNRYAKDLRTPKYKMRVKQNKKKKDKKYVTAALGPMWIE